MELAAPIEPGQKLLAETHNGSITVVGEERENCKVTLTIRAKAGSIERALELAEATEARLEPCPDGLVVTVKKPKLRSGWSSESVGWDIDAAAPRATALAMKSHNGRIEIVDVGGQADLETHNGRIDITRATGGTEAKTHNGSIYCRGFTGRLKLVTHNGKVKAACGPDAQAVCDIDIRTHNGGIDLTIPETTSAAVEATTHNGSIRTELPVTVTGKLGKRLRGSMGDGQGRLKLETHNGSIRIHKAG